MAAFGRSIHDDHIRQTQATSVLEVFTDGLKFGGTVSNMIAGVVPPSLSMWHHPTQAADLGLAALERGDLKEAASSLRRATLHLDRAEGVVDVHPSVDRRCRVVPRAGPRAAPAADRAPRRAD